LKYINILYYIPYIFPFFPTLHSTCGNYVNVKCTTSRNISN